MDVSTLLRSLHTGDKRLPEVPGTLYLQFPGDFSISLFCFPNWTAAIHPMAWKLINLCGTTGSKPPGTEFGAPGHVQLTLFK